MILIFNANKNSVSISFSYDKKMKKNDDPNSTKNG